VPPPNFPPLPPTAARQSGWKASVTLSWSNSPLTQAIAGAFAPAGSVVSTVTLDPPGAAGVVGVSFAANSSGAVVFSLLNADRLPSRTPVRARVGVLEPGASALKYGLVSVAGAPNKPPTGPATVTIGAAVLGVPLVVPESVLLNGWSDPDGNAIGVISARVRDRRRGVAAATALAPASWSPVSTIQKRRITELTYNCQLSALTVRRRFPGPSARKPKCIASGGKLVMRVSDARYATKGATGLVSVQQGPSECSPGSPIGIPVAAEGARRWRHAGLPARGAEGDSPRRGGRARAAASAAGRHGCWAPHSGTPPPLAWSAPDLPPAPPPARQCTPTC
jgi:hypothetical protein